MDSPPPLRQSGQAADADTRNQAPENEFDRSHARDTSEATSCHIRSTVSHPTSATTTSVIGHADAHRRHPW